MKQPNNKIIKGLTITVKDGNFNKALRQFRRAVDEDGRIKEVHERRYAVSPSEKRKVAKKRAIARNKRKLREEQLKNKPY